MEKRRVYGRRMTRPPGQERQDALDTLLPTLGIPDDLVSGKAGLAPQTLFTKKFDRFWFEIGFGNGEHLAGLMDRHPDIGFLGAEPFINGMSAFLKTAQAMPNDNVRVWMEDAIILAMSLPDACLERIYVLNPDPWPKKRHHKRRIISQPNLDQFARILKPGGRLIMATDVDDLAGWMVTQASNHAAFEWTAETAQDWQTMPEDWIETRYQKKGAAKGRQQTYLIFERRQP